MEARTPATSRAHGVLLVLGFLAAAGLLGRLTFDLIRLDVLFAIAIGTFYLGFLTVGGSNAVSAVGRRRADGPRRRSAETALSLAIILAPLASIMDCMGLSFTGCTPRCGFLMQVVTPVIGVLAFAFLFTRRSVFLTAASAAALAYVVPNCVCYNPVNAFWIDRIDYSPACFAGALGVIVMALGALRTGRLVAPAIVISWLAVIAMFGFWIGHHYYRWPW